MEHYQSTSGHEMLHANRSSKDEQLVITFSKNQKENNMAGVKVNIFMGTAHETLHLLDKEVWYRERSGIYAFYLNHFLPRSF
jgi:hypothetical protein